MRSKKAVDVAGRRRQVPSHDPMPGIDDKPIDAGRTTGAQLPPKEDDKERKSNLNPNQGDLLKPFWADN